MTLCDTINTDRWRASQILPALIARKLQIPTAAGNTTQIQQVATHTLPLKRTFAKTAAAPAQLLTSEIQVNLLVQSFQTS